MVLTHITPVLLTCNEAANIERTLGKLRWARDIVVLDSGSTDGTLDVVSRFPNVRLFHRTFDEHAAQWTHAVTQTGIETAWVLALDADYVLSDGLVEELSRLAAPPDIDGYECAFVYCVGGRGLRAALYPPVTVLFRRSQAAYVQDGHTHRVKLPGRIGRLEGRIFHDDRKPMRAWFSAQTKYMRLEAEKLVNARWASLDWPDRIRTLRIVAPAAIAAHCLIGQRLVLDGRAGLFYTFQRVFAEALLALHLLGHDFARMRTAVRGARARLQRHVSLRRARLR